MPVDHDEVGPQRRIFVKEIAESGMHGEMRGAQNIDRVDQGDLAHRQAPKRVLLKPSVKMKTGGGIEELGIVQARIVKIMGKADRAGDDGPGQGAAAGFVDADEAEIVDCGLRIAD